MRRLLSTLLTVPPALLLALLILAAPAWPQDAAPDEAPPDEPTAPAPSGSYLPYLSAEFGFSLNLPASGRFLSPDSDGWHEPPGVALWWLAGDGEPVKGIQVRVDDFSTTLDEDIFTKFCTTLLSNWSEDPERFTVYTRNLAQTISGQTWNLIEVSDNAHPSGAVVYYSVFSAYSGSRICTVTLYYYMETNDAVRDFGKPVIQSFKLLPPTEPGASEDQA